MRQPMILRQIERVKYLKQDIRTAALLPEYACMPDPEATINHDIESFTADIMRMHARVQEKLEGCRKLTKEESAYALSAMGDPPV